MNKDYTLPILVVIALGIGAIAIQVSNFYKKQNVDEPLIEPPPVNVQEPEVQPTPTPAPSLEDQLIKAHNDERHKRGKAPLSKNMQLMSAAQKHATWMAANKRLSHMGDKFSRPSSRVADEGYKWIRVGENVAEGQRSVNVVMMAWMDSPLHERNVLGDYKDIGVARAQSPEGRYFWCVIFASPRNK